MPTAPVTASSSTAPRPTLSTYPTAIDSLMQRDTFLQHDTLTQHDTTLRELVVTATTRRGPGSASIIGRDAMAHVQPSSIADLLELLPGHMSKTPDFSKASTITLRETGGVSATGQHSTLSADYAMTSLGTLFMVDGAPLSADGNAQAIAGTETRGSAVNRGIDMRTIGTDNIKSVEVIQGIPSAEYGNLTSGVVNISRIYSATPLTARLKVDGFSTLASLSKGVEIGRHSINADIGALDSRTDPRDPRDTYRRLTASLRGRLSFGDAEDPVTARISVGSDYTGSFDDVKNDADLQATKIDDFKSSYTQWGLNTQTGLTFRHLSLLRHIDLNASLRHTRELLQIRRQVAPQRAAVAPTSLTEGESMGQFLIGEYIADFTSDSRPTDLNIRLSGDGTFSLLSTRHRWKSGVEYQRTHNAGSGQTYDLTKPLSGGWTTRPRRYSDIPSLSTMSGYMEDNIRWSIQESEIDAQVGLRMVSMPWLDSRYTLSGRVYADPRANINYTATLAYPSELPMRLTIGLGYGIATRMPTADYLFPQIQYIDMIQLSHYPSDPASNAGLVSLRTYIVDPCNYSLQAARNTKYEIRTSLEWGGNRIGITPFFESMKSGYRYATSYLPYTYRQYDPTAVDPSAGIDILPLLPYTTESVLRGVSRPDNGTRIDKAGIEYQLQTMRFRPLHTAVTVTGAWLCSRYSNSRLLYDPVSVVIGQKTLSDIYVGLYDSDEGRINQQCNTNIMFDTQWPRYGMVFTTSLQCLWWVKTRRLPQQGTPTSYISAADGLLHPYTEEDASHPELQHLIQHYNPELYRTQTVPPALYLNLRVSKQIGRHLRVSAFVNSLLDYLPDYTVNGLTVRRGSEAYFGMEANITI